MVCNAEPVVVNHGTSKWYNIVTLSIKIQSIQSHYNQSIINGYTKNKFKRKRSAISKLALPKLSSKSFFSKSSTGKVTRIQ
jgi:hypothetical protein